MTGTLSSHTAEATTPFELSALFEPVATEFKQVEESLRSNLVDDSPFVATLLSQVFSTGGKRIRPGLVLLSSGATLGAGAKFTQNHIILAVLTELIHTASLVHDDVIDKASVRRGQETVNRRWNDKLAVLVGDLLFAQASICLARLQNPAIVGIYGQVLGDLCAGEIKQMNQQFVCQVNWQAYMQKSICKTASLFSAGCHSGPILNLAPAETVEAMRQYGTNLGICFQIVDDLLDVTSSESTLGKPAGSDLAQGILTAPALFVLQQNNAASRELETLIKTRAVSQPGGAAVALSIIKDNGGVEQTVKLARNYASKSKDALKLLTASPYKDSLASMIDLLLERTH